ncbi:hypothetical protein EDD22DRAFT_974439 [Suillus occidentalis]|nr:hypothetical protein EDD22DRAFT_974439 [Suillus occidentalis]
MVKYCGYLVRDDLMLQRALELGLEPPEDADDRTDMILLAARNLMGNTGVLRSAKLRRVKTPKGTKFWCIAFSSNDPNERLPGHRAIRGKVQGFERGAAEEIPASVVSSSIETRVQLELSPSSNTLARSRSYSSRIQGIAVMATYYCGYLVPDEFLLQRAVEKLGQEPPENAKDENELILMAVRNLMGKTGVLRSAKLRRVKTPKGITWWCIAFSSNDPCDRLPATAPPEEQYKALKEALQKKGPPQWYKSL